MSIQYSALSRSLIRLSILATVVFGAPVLQAAEPDPALVGWLGKEMTVDGSTFNDHVPLNAKLTFVADAEDDVVRICTRNVAAARGTWRSDMAPGCNVALRFTRGTRYCTSAEVRTGNAEVLSSCHRLRSQDVAMHPAVQKGALELHDVLVFLIVDGDGEKRASILVDSPSRVTHDGTATICCGKRE